MQIKQISNSSFTLFGQCDAYATQSDNAIQLIINMSTETQFNSEYKISNKSRNLAPEYAAYKPTLRLGRLVRFRTRLPYQFYLK